MSPGSYGFESMAKPEPLKAPRLERTLGPVAKSGAEEGLELELEEDLGTLVYEQNTGSARLTLISLSTLWQGQHPGLRQKPL